jgi:hypothetical protein
MGAPAEIWLEANPERLTREITNREVPTALGSAMLLNRINAGTMTKPPPTPKSPERNPVSTPTKIISRAQRV